MSVVAMLQGSPEIDLGTSRSALVLAQKLGLPLTGLCALPDPQSAIMVVASPEATGLTGMAASNIIKLQEEVRAKAEAAFRDAVGTQPGVDCVYLSQVATAEHAAASAATLADAIFFPRTAARSGEPLSIAFDHVMMDARLPVILDGTDTYKVGPVVIGWDGSNGAARAVRFHTPLLRAAGEVIIAQNRKDAERDGARPGIEPGSLQSWLERKGIRTRSAAIEGEVATSLLGLVKENGATALVAGAYGHSRIGERLFGGTSKRLLTAEEAPALALAR